MPERFTIRDILRKVPQRIPNDEDTKKILLRAVEHPEEADRLKEELVLHFTAFTVKITNDAIRLFEMRYLDSDKIIAKIDSSREDIYGEGLLALNQVARFFSSKDIIEKQNFVKRLNKAIYNVVEAYIRTNVLNQSSEIPVSSFRDPDGEKLDIEKKYSDMSDNEADKGITEILLKEEIVKELSEYPDKQSVEILYAYCGLHRDPYYLF